MHRPAVRKRLAQAARQLAAPKDDPHDQRQSPQTATRTCEHTTIADPWQVESRFSRRTSAFTRWNLSFWTNAFMSSNAPLGRTAANGLRCRRNRRREHLHSHMRRRRKQATSSDKSPRQYEQSLRLFIDPPIP